MAGEYALPDDGRRPWRVLPLAVAAVMASIAVAGVASGAMWELSGERYAHEVARDLF